MCSVSLIRPAPDTLRLAMNRDEQRNRAAERSPYCWEDGNGPRRLLTHDGAAGGAWSGVNVAGVMVALLNHSPGPAPTADCYPVSRGVIVPDLLRCPSRQSAGERLRSVWTRSTMAPWTVIIADGSTDEAWRWDGQRLAAVSEHGPWSSSSLGDERVAAPRAQRWHELSQLGDVYAVQDAWHRDQTGIDPVAWVLMRRRDARTVSRTEITVTKQAIELRWITLGEHGHGGHQECLIQPRHDLLTP